MHSKHTVLFHENFITDFTHTHTQDYDVKSSFHLGLQSKMLAKYSVEPNKHSLVYEMLVPRISTLSDFGSFPHTGIPWLFQRSFCTTSFYERLH